MNFFVSVLLAGVLLMPQTVSVNADAIRVRLKLPDGMKFAEGAPFLLRFSSDHPEIVKIEKESYSTPAESLNVPIRVRPGEAMVRIRGRVCYCQKAGGEQCFVKGIESDISVRVGAEGSGQILADIGI